MGDFRKISNVLEATALFPETPGSDSVCPAGVTGSNDQALLLQVHHDDGVVRPRDVDRVVLTD